MNSMDTLNRSVSDLKLTKYEHDLMSNVQEGLQQTSSALLERKDEEILEQAQKYQDLKERKEKKEEDPKKSASEGEAKPIKPSVIQKD